MRALVFALALSACSPATRVAGRCPTTATLLTDFVISGAGLAASTQAFNTGHPVISVSLFGAAMAVGLAASMSECRR